MTAIAMGDLMSKQIRTTTATRVNTHTTQRKPFESSSSQSTGLMSSSLRRRAAVEPRRLRVKILVQAPLILPVSTNFLKRQPAQVRKKQPIRKETASDSQYSGARRRYWASAAKWNA